MNAPARPQTEPHIGGDRGVSAYWAVVPDDLLSRLGSRPDGLSSAEAARRLAQNGLNRLDDAGRRRGIHILLVQFRSPLTLILVFAAVISGIAGDLSDAAIIAAIVLGSGLLSFFQEYRASAAMEALLKRVSHEASVVRDGRTATVPAEELVAGDIVELNAGDLIPADGVLLDAKDFFVVQSAMTGEAFPVQKSPGKSAEDAGLAGRTNAVFMGTSVRSGTARAVVAVTGASTEFGAIAGELEREEGETAFVRGIRHFGYFMSEAMAAIVVVVLAANIALDRPLLESLLFSVALAVGLTPQLLPAIISVTLSRGANQMAAAGVIVKRLGSIENLGSMDVLCTDKTGTISVGVVELADAVAADGRPSQPVMEKAYLNAMLQTGMSNPLDEAIVKAGGRQALATAAHRKIDEVPYDFARKRLSVIVEDETRARTMIVKGAFENVLEACTAFDDNGKHRALEAEEIARLHRAYETWGGQGFRVLAVASKAVAGTSGYTQTDECDLTLDGVLLFSDPPKPDAGRVIAELRRRGVRTKIITGDNRFVAAHLAGEVGLNVKRILIGSEIASLSNEALVHRAARTELFAEVDPNQKERIVHALRQSGHVVGYLGDGINDATALQNADIGISVDQAVDVAKEAADMVLMQRDLNVLCQGIDDGRRIFANTMKYISVTTSANFGNMVSMAAASLFLPFLPLLAKQILLNNFLSDLPALAIADDDVDDEMIEKPHHWDIGYIRRFMVCFGLVSSAFDVLTFAVLLGYFNASETVFRTGWFMESLLTEIAILLVIRTRSAFFRSRPGNLLALSSAGVALFALTIPYLPFAPDLGFAALPFPVMGALLAITAAYIAVSELTKSFFFRAEAARRRRRSKPRRPAVRRRDRGAAR